MRIALFLLFVFAAGALLQGCPAHCYSSLLQLRAHYEDKCTELSPSRDPSDGLSIRTFVCGGRDGDAYVSYKEKGGGSYCFNDRWVHH